MTQAAEIFLSRPRIVLEEGDKLKPYDDATAKAVVAPVGNLSWGWGFNLMQCGSEGLFEVMAAYLVGQVELELAGRTPWYGPLAEADPLRASVYLDVAYNAGVAGLLHGFPSCVQYAAVKNWTASADQLRVKDARLDLSRYAPLRQILIGNPAQ